MKLTLIGCIFLIAGFSLAFNAHAGSPIEKVANVTDNVSITLTEEACTMFPPPKDVILFKAYAVDSSINPSAVGCWSKEADGMVVVNLVNTTNSNMYGYVLPQGLFKPKSNI